MTDKVKQLTIILADTYAVYVKTQSYHWNVEGADFYALHKFFEEQYQALAEAVDELAERIRALGSKVAGDFKSYQDHTNLGAANPDFSSKEMLQDLHDDHSKIVKSFNDALPVFEGDEATTDLIIERLAWHEKQVWMLGSHFK